MTNEHVGGLAPSAVVRFALEANLEAYRTQPEGAGTTGRQALARALGVGEPRLSEFLRSGAKKLDELVVMAEDRELAPQETLTRLARQVQLTPRDYRSVGAVWWPKLRKVHRLGVPEPPTFGSAVHVLMAAQAFAAHHTRLLERPPNAPQHVLSPEDGRSCGQLLSHLCSLASGPYGVGYECHNLIAQLAPLAPTVVTEFITSGVVTTQVIQALDRSLRRAAWNSTMKQQYQTLLANPPAKIYRRTHWMRALRRLSLSDYRSTRGSTELPRHWVLEQLLLALQGQQAYAGARSTDRRYAFWCLAELAPEGDHWREAQRVARSHADVYTLLVPALQLRRFLGVQPLDKRDGFNFEPESDWSASFLTGEVYDLLNTSLVANRSWRHRDIWRWGARPRTVEYSLRLLRTALFDPDVIRQRAAMDAVRAAGPNTVNSISQTTVALTEILLEGPTPDFVMERCLATLGLLGQEESISTVERALRTARGEVLVQGVAAAGDLAEAHPSSSHWMMASAATAVTRSSAYEDVLIAGIAACVAYRWDPRVRLREALSTQTSAVIKMLEWADRVLIDPLLPTQEGLSTG